LRSTCQNEGREAARFILNELKKHPNGLTYGKLVKWLQDIGEAETRDNAEKLVERAAERLGEHIIVTKVGRNTLYRLRGETTPQLPTTDTYIVNVGNVGNCEVETLITDTTDKSDKYSDVGNVGNVGSRVTTVTELPTLPTNTIYVSDVGNPKESDWQWDYIASDIPILPELVSFGDLPKQISFGNLPEQVSHANPTKPCQYTETDVSCPQSPEIPEPTYSTLRNEELIDTELLISELDELCVELSAQPEQPTLSEKPEPFIRTNHTT